VVDTMRDSRLLVFGCGYVGCAVADAAMAAGFAVTGTTRTAATSYSGAAPNIDFADAASALAQATHLLTTAPPDGSGDPVLSRYGAAIAAAKNLRWTGYLSTTGVYGDRGGAWIDEDTEPAPISDRSRRRLAAENDWRCFDDHRAVDIFRLAGIYGPGRSALDDLRTGNARRVSKPGHAFGRIHRDDIVRAVVAAMGQDRTQGTRILNLADDEPAESADVMAEAARLLRMPPPPAVPFEQLADAMSPIARSFWAENRKVSSRRTQQALVLRWLYPTYREGLRAILAKDRAEGAT
jgi:nucleoside-diphosphate-sugar epimerase